MFQFRLNMDSCFAQFVLVGATMCMPDILTKDMLQVGALIVLLSVPVRAPIGPGLRRCSA